MCLQAENSESKQDERNEDAEKEDGEAANEKSMPFAARRAILSTAFGLSDKGQLTVAEAADEETCYLVRFDDSLAPDPSGFESKKGNLERRLQQQRRAEYLTQWRRDTFLQAAPQQSAIVPGEEGSASSDVESSSAE